MRLTRTLALGTTILSLAAGAVLAAAHSNAAAEGAMKARQSHMKLYAFNLGTLGGMAKGQIDYDAERAGAAAANLAALAMLDQSGYWVEGSSSEDMPDSDALPAIWQNMEDFQAKIDALAEAADALDSAADQGLSELQAAMGAVGSACGACHKQYRKPDDA